MRVRPGLQRIDILKQFILRYIKPVTCSIAGTKVGLDMVDGRPV